MKIQQAVKHKLFHFAWISLSVALQLAFLTSANAQYSYSNNYEIITSEFSKLFPGLSQNDVNCIMQDKNGYLWIGTWDGLNKYDGYNFTVIRPDLDYPSRGITHRTVNAIYEDVSGKIWIGTDKGLNLLDHKTFTFRHFYADIDNPNALLNDTITSITGDQSGNVFIGTKSGVNLIDKNLKISRIRIQAKNCKTCQAEEINHIYLDDNHILWIATECGLKAIDPYTGNCNIPVKIASFIETTSIPFHTVVKDRNNHLWAGSTNGLYMFNLINGNIVRYHSSEKGQFKLKGDEINALCIDKEDLLWVGTNGNGLQVFSSLDGRDMSTHFSFIKQFDNYFIKSLLIDQNGILWVGTTWQGMIKYNRHAFSFEHFLKKQNDNTGLNSSIIWSFCENKLTGDIWIGTNNGINIFHPETGTFTYMVHDPKNPNSLSGNLIRDIFIDSEGIIWISTFGQGLNRYDPVTKKFKVYHSLPEDQHSLSCDYVWKVYEDRFGVLWVGTDCGLNVLDRKTGKFKHYHYSSSHIHSISSNSIFSIYEDSKGQLWFSTYNGLNLYHRQTDNFSALSHISGQNSLSVSSVFSVFEDSKGIFWIGTFGGGLNRYDPVTKKFRHYTEKDGLANNIVYRILEDSKGYLWMSTNHGITRFDPKNESFVNYDVKDGVQGYEFNHNAALMDSRGYIYFGGMNGFNRFLPENIHLNKNIPSTVVTGFWVFDTKRFSYLNNLDTIILKYNENFFTIEFSALDFTNPAKNKYLYRLKNFKNSWTPATADKRWASFTNVPPGTYFFTIIASNNDGIWNNTGTTLCIIIRPPFWKTWWFYAILILISLLIVYLIFTYYIFRIKTKHDLEKKMLTIEKEYIDAQQKALRYQMNPHFIFNSLNSIQNFILQKNEETAHIYLTNFSSLIRKILENSKHETISLDEEIETIRLYLELESLRFSDKFEYQIIISKDIKSANLSIPPMLIQPYLENAIWHGLIPKEGHGKIMIEFKLHTRHTLLISITDNGIGREKSAEISARRKQHKPTGMRNIEERLELMNRLNKTNMRVVIKDLKDENGQPSGTRVDIYVSYHKNETFSIN